MKKPNRRQFAKMLAVGAAVPLVPQAPAPQEPPVSSEALELRMKPLAGIPMSEDRNKQIRQSMEQSIRQVDKIRAYSLNRATEPALMLGMMFDAAPRGGRRAG